MDSAVEGIVDAIWFNQGEVCCAGSRLLVQESIADLFLKRLRVRMETLRLGDPLDKATDIGAVVADIQLDGRVFPSNAVLGGVHVIRVCIVNFRTEADQLDLLLEVAEELGRKADADLRPEALR